MIAEPPEFDPITVWQNQPQHSTPSLEEIAVRARAFEAKNRRNTLIFSIALALHVTVSVIEDATIAKGAIWWVGVVRFALFITWVAYIPFRKNTSALTSLRIAALTPVLDFYRGQLERQRDYFQDDHRLKTQFIAIAIGFILYSVVYPSLFLVFGIPIIVAAAIFHQRRRRELPEIQRELEALDRLRKESQ